MINYETILSTFDDKLTLLQWLQKVEEALQGAGLERVDITQVTPTTAVFKFTFADGTSLTTPSITLPRGPKGDTGPQGQTGPQGPVGPKGSYEVVELTSTSGTLSDATYNKIETNDVIIDYKVATTHHYLFKISDTSTTTMYGAIQNDTSRMYIFSVTKATKEYTITNKYIEVNETKVQVVPSADVVGKVLTVKNDYTSYWADNTPEGNKVKSTSANSGQVLTADGNGGASWQDASGGEKYLHNLRIWRNGIGSGVEFEATAIIVNNSSTKIETGSGLRNALRGAGFDTYQHYTIASGLTYDHTTSKHYIIVGLYGETSTNITFWAVAEDSTTAFGEAQTVSQSSIGVSDIVTTL